VVDGDDETNKRHNQCGVNQRMASSMSAPEREPQNDYLGIHENALNPAELAGLKANYF
jgi:hypothetical protein